MPPIATVSYALLFLSTTAYAIVLEHLRRDVVRTYAPRWTWLTVVIGVAIVGAFVALHQALYIPHAYPYDVAWWAWWVWVGHFVAGGAPIIIWQLIVDRRDADAAIQHMLERMGERTRE